MKSTDIDLIDNLNHDDDDEIEIARNEPTSSTIDPLVYSDFGDYKFFYHHTDVSISPSSSDIQTPKINNDDENMNRWRRQQQQQQQSPYTPKKPVIKIKNQIKTTTTSSSSMAINKFPLIDNHDDDNDDEIHKSKIMFKTKIRYSRLDGKVVYLNDDDDNNNEIFNDISPILSPSPSSSSLKNDDIDHQLSKHILDDYNFPSKSIDSINDNDSEIFLSHDQQQQTLSILSSSSSSSSLVDSIENDHDNNYNYDDDDDDDSIGLSKSFSSLNDYLQNLLTKQKKKNQQQPNDNDDDDD